MQKENIDIAHSSEIKSTVAIFKNFSPEKPIENAVVYYWESHNENPDDEKWHQATIELIYKVFDMYSCEKYEIRTGYLDRYNFLSKPINESSTEEIEEAIIKGKKRQTDWVNRVNPKLLRFKTKDWRECVFKDENSYHEDCKNLIIEELREYKEFSDAFARTVSDYAERRGTNTTNGELYLIEEAAWILSLPLLHLNKPIYLIHVGLISDAIRELFDHFSNLQRAVKWLCPKLRDIRFKNTSDFLMDYRNNKNVGYSYAMENKDIVNPIVTFNREHHSTKEELSLALSREINEKNMLLSLIERLPGHIYWLNRDNIYVGCNELQAKDLGFESRNDIIGKTNDDLHTKEDSVKLNSANIMVMESGKDFEGEEPSSSYKRGEYISHKTPLFDTHGKVIGLLGISIDITDRKKAERLEISNKSQQLRIQDQEEFRIFIEQISHDIRSPLRALGEFESGCSYLKLEDRTILNGINEKIQGLAGAILNRREKNLQTAFDSKERDILVPLLLEDAILQKKYEFKEKNIEFKYSFNPMDRFIFIIGNQISLICMISNLINNAVEAFESNDGIVEITLNADDKTVKIEINDSGKGMPQETVDKILKGEPIGTTKTYGNGIGLGQIRDTVFLHRGKMSIESKEGAYTKITLTFPRSGIPSWFTDQITLRKGNIVAILDDDEDAHDVWKDLFKNYSNDLILKFFTKGHEAMEFINFSFEKDNIFFISDYDLREEYTGLLRIMETQKQQQSLIVAAVNNNLQEAIEKTNVKMFPKQFLKDIQIVVG